MSLEGQQYVDCSKHKKLISKQKSFPSFLSPYDIKAYKKNFTQGKTQTDDLTMCKKVYDKNNSVDECNNQTSLYSFWTIALRQDLIDN